MRMISAVMHDNGATTELKPVRFVVAMQGKGQEKLILLPHDAHTSAEAVRQAQQKLRSTYAVLRTMHGEVVDDEVLIALDEGVKLQLCKHSDVVMFATAGSPRRSSTSGG